MAASELGLFTALIRADGKHINSDRPATPLRPNIGRAVSPVLVRRPSRILPTEIRHSARHQPATAPRPATGPVRASHNAPQRPAHLSTASTVNAAVRPSGGLAGEVGINATARKAVNAGPARFGWLNPFPIRVLICTDAFFSTGKLPGAAMIHRNPSAGGSYGCGPLDHLTEYRALRPATPHGTR